MEVDHFPKTKSYFPVWRVSFCYILKIVFTLCLVEDGWILVSPSASSLLCVVFLKSMKRMAPPIRTRCSFPLSLSPQEASISYPFPSEGKQTENHNHRKLTNLITWTTALSNSMKLWAMPCSATQDRQVVVESSDKMWSTGEGNGKPLNYSYLENTMNNMKRQKR